MNVELLSLKWLNPDYPLECRITVKITWTTGMLWWKETHTQTVIYRGFMSGWHNEATGNEIDCPGSLAQELERLWRIERWAREDEIRDKDKNVLERLADESVD